jgi:hypothetical protein
MTATAVKTTEPTQQDVCIDLPGETVQCWRSSDNIRVVLRKHRDVIFDLNLGTGKSYTVEANESDFYNARDKKLVYAKRRGTVTFEDGERLHLWVTRNFKGALILKSGGETLMKLVPNEVDSQQYDDEPKTKPAPIIVALGSKESAKPPPSSNGGKSPTSHVSTPISSSAPLDEQVSLVCVVEGTIKNMPAVVEEHFMKGGGKSGLANIDPFEVATSNWIWGQVAGSVAYAADNWSWLRASIDSRTHAGFRLVSAKMHLVKGKVRFYFSGYSKYNAVFGSGGFGPAHDRILGIFAGVGKTSSALAAVSKGVAGTFKGNAFVNLIFSTATAYAEWKDDAKKDYYDLIAAVLAGVLKAIVAAALAILIVAVIVFLVMAAASFSVPVLAVGLLTAVVSVGTGYFVDAGDKKIGKIVTDDNTNKDGLAGAIAPAMRNAGHILNDAWNHLSKKFPTDYSGRWNFERP